MVLNEGYGKIKVPYMKVFLTRQQLELMQEKHYQRGCETFTDIC
jgi:hypothetical protein